MKARSVARELALLVLFQLDLKSSPEKLLDTLNQMSLSEMVVSSVRTLQELSKEHLESAMDEVIRVREFITDSELDHPDNENIPYTLPTVSVPLPQTKAFTQLLDQMLQSLHQLSEAMVLPEVLALSKREDVRNYTQMLVKAVIKNLTQIDSQINTASTDWKVERLLQIDLTLLRLAVAEIVYTQQVDTATTINDIIELAKQFTTEESRKFIHGVLGGIVDAQAGASHA